MRVLAPAKINLHLRVAPVNGDGFHPLQSWMCTVGLFDILKFDFDPTSRRTVLSCDDPTLDCGESNLVLRAVRAIESLGEKADGGKSSVAESDHRGSRELNSRDRGDGGSRDDSGHFDPADVDSGRFDSGRFDSADVGRPDVSRGDVGWRNVVSRDVGSNRGGLRIHLEKLVPTGGGLGGGSSDAAHTLIALSRLWEQDLSPEALASIAATLGSDVAFFCHGPSSVCTDRGQIVRPIDVPSAGHAVLILPSITMPTGPVYRRFDELLSPSDRAELKHAVAAEVDWSAWTKLSADALLPLLVNDLERPAFDLNPPLAKCRAEVEQFVGRIVRMSGSGSSLFTLYDDPIQAERAAATLDGSTRPDGTKLRVMAVPIAPELTPIDAVMGH